MFKFSPTPIQTFKFEVYPAGTGYYDGEFRLFRSTSADKPSEPNIGEFSVSIRQGTFGEDKQRSETFWQRRRIVEGGEVREEILNWAPQGLVETDLSITITDIVGLDIEGLETPKFTGSGTTRRPADTQQFLAFMRGLPSQWIETLYDAVLEVNPKWAPKS